MDASTGFAVSGGGAHELITCDVMVGVAKVEAP
jgi:hypothetical protein